MRMDSVRTSFQVSSPSQVTYGREWPVRNLCIDAFGAEYDIEALENLASLIVHDDSTKRMRFTVLELDEIAKGKELPRQCSHMGDGHYLHGLFSSLGWWKSVAEQLTSGRESVYADPQFRKEREKGLKLLAEVFSGIVPAMAQTMFYTETDSLEPHIELLRRYRRFTRHVCTWARKVWPEVNLQRLLKRP